MRMRKNKFLLFIIFLFDVICGYAQTPAILSYSDFISHVQNNHPIAKRAALIDKENRFIRMQAKGELDPVLNAIHNQKNYDEKNYYSISSIQLDMPLWPGIDLKAGYDYTRGFYLNDENILPGNGLLFAGIKFPLAQGIVTDKRRTAIALAGIYSDINLNEREMMLIGLFADAYIAYAEWTAAYMYNEIYKEALSLSENRLIFTRAMQKNGERAAIDTLEAYIQYQTRLIQLNQSNADYITATNNLESFLWNNNLQPLIINSNVIPDTTFLKNTIVSFNFDSLQKTISNIDEQNPQVKLYKLKQNVLKTEYIYKRDLLKPKIYGSYNFLSEPLNSSFFVPSINNYKFGLDFSFPLFIRKQRADVGLNKIKQQENSLFFELKKIEVTNKLQAVFNELNVLIKQTTDMGNIYSYYLRLYDAERTKFINGESSVFMVNARESQLIESELKWYEFMVKYARKKAVYNYLSGQKPLP